MVPISISDFIDLNVFESGNLHKTRVLCFRTFGSRDAVFVDLYIQNRDKVYIIMTGKNTKTGEMNIEIQLLETEWDLKLHNVCYDSNTNKCVDVFYYTPRYPMFVSDIKKNSNSLETNFFKVYDDVKQVIFNFDKRSFKKGTSYDFLDKYFKQVKDYEHVKFKIKENDDFTRKC